MQLKDLPIGSIVVDPSWEWEHRAGSNYTGEGVVKPIEWIVVAKNHSGYPSNSVTLFSKESLAVYVMDNSTNRAASNGSGHYGDTGAPNATRGIRKFLNGSAYNGSDKNNYNVTLYDKASEKFRENVLTTTLHNRLNNASAWGTVYYTQDKFFIPSDRELRKMYNNLKPVGEQWAWTLPSATSLWTRTPTSDNAGEFVYINGTSPQRSNANANRNIRPALNMRNDVTVKQSVDSKGNTIYILDLYEKKHLIKYSNKIQTFFEGSWQEVEGDLNKELFETYGMDDISNIPQEKWDELERPVEIYTWTDNKDAIGTNVSYTYNHFENPKLELTMPEYKPICLLESPTLLTWTDVDHGLAVRQTVLAENKIRYLLSKDSVTWVGYNGEEWIKNYEMTKEELELLESDVFKEWFGNSIYQKDLYYKILLQGQNPYNTPIVRRITTIYNDNQCPLILDPKINPDIVHNEYVTVTGTLQDLEGDSIQYRVLIKKAGESSFKVADNWVSVSNNFTFTRAYNFPYFIPGINQIKVEVKDSRGKVTSWVGNLILLNTEPTITLTHTDFVVEGVIGDEDGDEVSYRVLVNGNELFDFVDFSPSPRHFRYSWDSSDLIFGEMNTIRVEVKDTHGGFAFQEFQVLGTYKGLLFMDEHGNYYTTDKGDILKLLDLGTIIGGQTTEVKKVILQNRNGFHIEDLEIRSVKSEIKPHVTLEISENEMPFIATPVIKFTEVMAHEDVKPFFVRVVSGKYARSGGDFEIIAKAEPAIT